MRLILVLAVLLLPACPPAVIHREICTSYVSCALGLNADEGKKVADTYGASSACWSDERQSLACVEGCQAGIASLQANGIKCEVLEVKEVK